MPRDPDALNLTTKWAASTTDVQTPEDRGLTRAQGWTSQWSQSGGEYPSREVFNQMFRELSALAVELNQRGLLEWDTSLTYRHPAVVMGSNGVLYELSLIHI